MEQEKIISYKGFDKDFKCRGFQYEVGKEYEEDGAKCCNKGFHACENPMDVWKYYDITDSRFGIVEQSGKIDKNDNKTCSSKIKIKTELKFADFIKLCVDTGVDKCKFKSNSKLNDNSVQIISNDNSTRINSSDDAVQIVSNINSTRISSNGNVAQIASSYYFAQIGSSGDYAQIGSSGDYTRIGSSGYFARIGSSGFSTHIGSSGYSAHISSSGNYVHISSSGNSAQICSSGNDAQISAIGNDAQIKSEGQDAVIMCAGKYSKARAKKGSWITLTEYDNNNGKPVCVKAEQVDGERIKEDTWYQLIDGEFKEVD